MWHWMKSKYYTDKLELDVITQLRKAGIK